MDNQASKYNFIEGEVLLVNKPLEWTSFDVVNKLRYTIKHKIGVKKIKVGHAGTLDPLADGLLIICTGKKTKTIESLMGMEKVYSGIIRLGSTTPSYDLETEINEHFDTAHITEEIIRQTAKSMEGFQDQYPPIFSAKKVQGKKAYDFARKGQDVELKPKEIEISKFDIVKVDGNDVHFMITCSKGTYIRSIAHDFGKKLDSGGHLAALRREAIGEYKLDGAMNVEEWLEVIKEN
ncbi:tRNA pseudouridine(55) synthase TruB [Paracrocinitomix mangrovi]|uniref:tRNA pseudouridine(55) synthase TruB n=1 Tax=Paracrocinitomix mangrovi TaxID=2862509 RepID=UPI001C8E5EB4|nr:tRNA pseudouridine(55) synthase TruB [Paracrocinitomix mangrovi]UKN00903.1 tRNA pseudouridine(55) synthase TruB [Paracrocinitomix mangrovi]